MSDDCTLLHYSHACLQMKAPYICRLHVKPTWVTNPPRRFKNGEMLIRSPKYEEIT